MLKIEEISPNKVVLSGSIELDIPTAISILSSFQVDPEAPVKLEDIQGATGIVAGDLGVHEIYCVMNGDKAGSMPICAFFDREKAEDVTAKLDMIGSTMVTIPIE